MNTDFDLLVEKLLEEKQLLSILVWGTNDTYQIKKEKLLDFCQELIKETIVLCEKNV
jgi:hypothetical protein